MLTTLWRWMTGGRPTVYDISSKDVLEYQRQIGYRSLARLGTAMRRGCV